MRPLLIGLVILLSVPAFAQKGKKGPGQGKEKAKEAAVSGPTNVKHTGNKGDQNKRMQSAIPAGPQNARPKGSVPGYDKVPPKAPNGNGQYQALPKKSANQPDNVGVNGTMRPNRTQQGAAGGNNQYESVNSKLNGTVKPSQYDKVGQNGTMQQGTGAKPNQYESVNSALKGSQTQSQYDKVGQNGTLQRTRSNQYDSPNQPLNPGATQGARPKLTPNGVPVDPGDKRAGATTPPRIQPPNPDVNKKADDKLKDLRKKKNNGDQ